MPKHLINYSPSVPRAQRGRCARCSRRYRGQADWNATMAGGLVAGLLCPSCQTVGESTEAEVNEAMLAYGVDSRGLHVGAPKREAH